MKQLLLSWSFKPFGRAGRDTRNTWITLMFVTKCRYNCFKKQSHIDTCTAAFKELEAYGFEFGEFGFGGNHVHFQANIPKRYSVQAAEVMLKSRSSRRMFDCRYSFRAQSRISLNMDYIFGVSWQPVEDMNIMALVNVETRNAF